MISIIANPEKYDGKNVQVKGFLHLEYEDYGLYLSKEDADYLRTENSLRMSFSEGEVEFEPLDRSSFSVSNLERKMHSNSNLIQRVLRFNCVNVMLEGIFDAKTGRIENVTRVLEECRWYDGEHSLSLDYRMKENAKAVDELFFNGYQPIKLGLAILALLISCFIFVSQAKRSKG
ncbi:MAG: hypothetical protein KIT34_09925 [Cyanobacteria bacterium TGS_CYA1]|nr:hypothetical protein [Cyanobacteria bacterium TGS_CYA1]